MQMKKILLTPIVLSPVDDESNFDGGYSPSDKTNNLEDDLCVKNYNHQTRKSYMTVITWVEEKGKSTEECIKIQTSKLESCNKKLYSLMTFSMDEDDQSEYCCELQRIDKKQVRIKEKL